MDGVYAICFCLPFSRLPDPSRELNNFFQEAVSAVLICKNSDYTLHYSNMRCGNIVEFPAVPNAYKQIYGRNHQNTSFGKGIWLYFSRRRRKRSILSLQRIEWCVI